MLRPAAWRLLAACCCCLCIQLLLQRPGIGLVRCCRACRSVGEALAAHYALSCLRPTGHALLLPCWAWRRALKVHLLLQGPRQRLISSSAGRRLLPVQQLLGRRLRPQALLQLRLRPASIRLPAGARSTAPVGLHCVWLPMEGRRRQAW
jgi:hypothetical protein